MLLVVSFPATVVIDASKLASILSDEGPIVHPRY